MLIRKQPEGLHPHLRTGAFLHHRGTRYARLYRHAMDREQLNHLGLELFLRKPHEGVNLGKRHHCQGFRIRGANDHPISPVHTV